MLSENLLENKENVKFGIELEYVDVNKSLIDNLVSDFNHKYGRKYLNLQDESVTRKDENKNIIGGEVITDILTYSFKDIQLLETVIQGMNNENAKVSSKVATHFHFSKDIFRNKNESLEILMQNMLIVIAYYENVFFTYYRGSKNDYRDKLNSYCKPIRNIVQYCLCYDKLDELNDQMKKNKHIRLTNIVRCLDTIEFRGLNGTLNIFEILNALNFYLLFLEAISENKFDIERYKYKLKNSTKQSHIVLFEEYGSSEIRFYNKEMGDNIHKIENEILLDYKENEINSNELHEFIDIVFDSNEKEKNKFIKRVA